MLSEALAALAAAGGTAVVQAVGTDAWTGFRQRLAGWLGRGDAQHENAELERLDRTADALEAAGPAEVERVRFQHEAAWQAHIEDTLDGLDDTEQAQAAEELIALLTQHASQREKWASQDGVTVTVNMYVGGTQTLGSSNAGGNWHRDAHVGRDVARHTPPGPENDPDDDWPQES